MHKIVLFVETNEKLFFKFEEIGNLFINRFAIDEGASSEILNIFKLRKISDHDQGMDHFMIMSANFA